MWPEADFKILYFGIPQEFWNTSQEFLFSVAAVLLK